MAASDMFAVMRDDGEEAIAAHVGGDEVCHLCGDEAFGNLKFCVEVHVFGEFAGLSFVEGEAFEYNDEDDGEEEGRNTDRCGLHLKM